MGIPVMFYRGKGEKFVSGSEIARFREQYELEYQAARRGLEGVAMVGSHQFITKRMENMWEQFQQLVEVVGQAEAHRIVFGESVEQRQEQGHGQE